MPLYEYECGKCGTSFDEYVDVKDRNNVRCKRCGELADRLISRSTGLNIFKPMWYEDICEKPIWVESRKQLKEECKKHDVIACRLL